MGNCAPTQPRPSNLQGAPIMMKQDPVWEKIRDYSFDRGHFYFVEEIQDIYTQIFGAYLIPDRVAMLVLDFKRFFYLVHRYYARHQPIQKTKEDSTLSFFPQPQMIASPILDRIWRLLLSNTRLYREFCDETLGGFLDRNVYINPKLDTYKISTQCYKKQFGDPSPLVWPEYASDQHLKQAYQGFFYIKASEFIDFHQQFERAYVFAGKVEEQSVLDKEITDLREQHRRELKQEGKEKVIWSEPMVNASPEPVEPPTKHEKVKIMQNNLEDDDDIEMDDVESSEEEEDEAGIDEKPEEKEEKKEEKEEEVLDSKAVEIEVKEEEVKETPVQEENKERAEAISILVGKQDRVQGFQYEDSKTQLKGDTQNNGLTSFSFDELKTLNRYLVANWQETYKQVLVALELYDIEKEVTHFFESDMNTSSELTEAVFYEYKRFLLLYSLGVSEQTFIPSHYIKVAWDNHLAQTVLYRKFSFQIFSRFLHSSPLPRQADDTQREAYVNTLRVYKILFKKYPPAQIWPDTNDRFDYQTLYSYKFFNIYAYIVEVLNKIQQKPQQAPKENEEERRERRLSISSMSVSTNPSRGREYISYKHGGS